MSARTSASPPTVSVSAPAKINIALRVGPLRPDGYHELATIYHAVGLRDTITVTAAEQLVLTLTGPESAGLPTDSTNLAWRAAELLAARFGITPHVSIVADKTIPVAAGLAGGSADAAATLVACSRLWQLPATPHQLAELAAELGSDVPFALAGGTAIGTGRGELVTPVPDGTPLHWVLAAAHGSLSTPAVYRELDRLRADEPDAPANAGNTGAGTLNAAVSAIARGDLPSLAAAMHNDLNRAALSLAPELAATLAAGEKLGALRAIVSGSGPTCAFLVADGAAADRLAASLETSGTCRWARATTGHAAGALGTAAGALGTAAGALGTAAGALGTPDGSGMV